MNKEKKIPIGYKKSCFGPIPIDYKFKKFEEIANVVRVGSPRPAVDPKYINDSYLPLVTVASLTGISDSQMEVLLTQGYLTEESSKQSRNLEKGTLILSNRGVTLGVAKILGIKCCTLKVLLRF